MKSQPYSSLKGAGHWTRTGRELLGRVHSTALRAGKNRQKRRGTANDDKKPHYPCRRDFNGSNMPQSPDDPCPPAAPIYSSLELQSSGKAQMNNNISPITFIDKLVKKNELGQPFTLMDHQREILRLPLPLTMTAACHGIRFFTAAIRRAARPR